MTNLKNLVGEYQYSNKVLTNNTGLRLLIANRTNTSKSKTPLFIVDKTTPKGGYISSLYPLATPNTYSFDYVGVKYNLIIEESKANIIHVLIS